MNKAKVCVDMASYISDLVVTGFKIRKTQSRKVKMGSTLVQHKLRALLLSSMAATQRHERTTVQSY